MNDVLTFLIGVTLGTVFAEDVRKVVPILDNSKGGANDKAAM